MVNFGEALTVGLTGMILFGSFGVSSTAGDFFFRCRGSSSSSLSSRLKTTCFPFSARSSRDFRIPWGVEGVTVKN